MIQKNTLIFVLCIALFSCNTESIDNTDETTNDSILLKKTIETDSDGEVYTTEYSYDDNKLISVISDGGYKNIYTYENDKIIREDQFLNGELAAYITLEYSSDEKIANYIEFMLEPSGLGVLAYKHILIYNNDNTITDKIYRGDFNSQTDLNYTITIILDEKNIIKTNQEDDQILSYSYDDKNGTFRNVHAIEVLNLLGRNEFGALIYGNTSNVTTITENGNGVHSTYEETFEYTYNDKDYPKTANYIFDNKGIIGFGHESTIEYFYE